MAFDHSDESLFDHPAINEAVEATSLPSGLSGNKRPYHLLTYRCENLVAAVCDGNAAAATEMARDRSGG
jgi:hypothetical protein